MKYNIIGDIHGRDSWKKLVREDAINIFLGDYMDPYLYEGTRTAKQTADNFMEIIRYKEEHPSTVLLLGNHDLHYIWSEHYSRYDRKNAESYRRLLLDNWDKMQLAYAIDDEVLITHAGVTADWLKLAGYPELTHPKEIAQMLNELKNKVSGKETEKEITDLLKVLTVRMTFEPWDVFGESPTASPIWARPEALTSHNALEKGKQVVGHTQMDEPQEIDEVCFVDALGTTAASLVVESTDGTYTYGIYAPLSE